MRYVHPWWIYGVVEGDYYIYMKVFYVFGFCCNYDSRVRYCHFHSDIFPR